MVDAGTDPAAPFPLVLAKFAKAVLNLKKTSIVGEEFKKISNV
jgi:hypothetical protein